MTTATEIEIESYSIIYSADWNPEYHKVSYFKPPKPHLWEMTEGDDQADWDHLGWTKHRKWCAMLSQEDFDVFIEETTLSAEDCETMGSIGAPGFGYGIAPAISFRLHDESFCDANAYVTPIPKGEPPEGWDPDTGWEIIRRQIIEKYR